MSLAAGAEWSVKLMNGFYSNENFPNFRTIRLGNTLEGPHDAIHTFRPSGGCHLKQLNYPILLPKQPHLRLLRWPRSLAACIN